MKKIVLATNNKHKLVEIKHILADLGYEVLTKGELGQEDFDVEETEDTLQGNSLLKAKGLKDLISSDYIVLADDTGLFVDALNGQPGVYSARYAGEAHDDKANRKKLLENLQGVSEEKRTARFKTVVTLVEDGKDPVFLEGVVEGKIAEEEKGEAGFGYDSVFVPNGYDKTFAQLGEAEKNKISHRHRALVALANYLKDIKN